MTAGSSSTAFSTMTLASGATIQLDGADASTNYMGLINRYAHFNANGTIIGHTVSGTPNQFDCEGMCSVIGATLTIPSSDVNWNNSTSFTYTSMTNAGNVPSSYWQGGNVYAAPIYGENTVTERISNSSGIGPSVFGNTSASFSGQSCSPACTGGNAILQTAVPSLAAVVSAGQYYLDNNSGVVYWWQNTGAFATVTFTTNYKYLSFTSWVIRTGQVSQTYDNLDVENSFFQFMGSPLADGLYVISAQNKSTLGAGGTFQNIIIKNNVFSYCNRQMSLALNTGTSTDPILVTGNTIDMIQLDGSGGYSAGIANTANNYLLISSNIVKAADYYFISGNSSTSTGISVKNNIIAGDFNMTCVGGTYPDLSLDGNLFYGTSGGGGDSRNFAQCLGSSGHNIVVSNNVYLHGFRFLNIDNYVSLLGNFVAQYPHHVLMGAGGSNVQVTSATISNNIFTSFPAGASDAICLHYNNWNWIDTATVSHNTINQESGWAGTDLSGDAFDNQGSSNQSNLFAHSNIIVVSTIGVRRSADTSAFNSRLHFDIDGWNDVFGNASNYSGWNQFSTIIGTSNVTGVSLFNPSATLPISGKTLTFTVTSNINQTLTWDGGSAVQLGISSGSVTSGASQVLNDTGAIFQTAENNANTPIGAWVKILSGTDSGDIRRIVNCTATSLTVVPDWTSTPDNTSKYAIYKAEVVLTASGATTVNAGTYWPSVPTITKSDSSISITSNTYSVDPQFVDSSRSFTSWDASLGGSGNDASALTRLYTNPSLVKSSLLPYLQGGFLPKNATLINAGYDGKTIGAVSSSSSPVGNISLSGPATCQEGQSCTYSASGGSSPYTFSLISPSSGSVTSGGIYTAPTHVPSPHIMNGCEVGPNNAVWNVPITNLPLSANTTIYMTNMDSNRLGGETSMRTANYPLSTDPTTPMSFYYDSSQNGNFVFPYTYTRVSEGGTMNGLMAGQDNHYLVTYRDTCMGQDNYQFYPAGINTFNLSANSQSGVIYPLERFDRPPFGVDAAGLPVAPLEITNDELQTAALGDINSIKHATRFTMDTASINAGAGIWPGFPSGTTACQAYGVTVNTSGTAVTLVSGGGGPGFRLGWPAGMTVTINSVNYILASVVTSSFTMTLTTSAGIQSGVALVDPATNCPPYGARFRMKSSYTPPSFDGLCPTTACHNIFNALIKAHKTYGLILADAGSNWAFDVADGQANGIDVYNALFEMASNVVVDTNTFEVIDESSLQTSSTGVTLDGAWIEAKLGNPYVTPGYPAVIQATDSLGSTGTISVALQGVAIGVQNRNEVVMAGSGSIQFSPWVTGSTTTTISCTISPSGGSTGTITTGCLFTAGSTSTVSGRSQGIVTVTSTADPLVTSSFTITTLPVDSSGTIHVALGKMKISGDYTDSLGNTWFNDMLYGQPVFFQGYSVNGDGFFSWTGTNASTALGLYSNGLLDSTSDIHLYMHVPNGTYKSDVFMGNFTTGTGQSTFSMDCNSVSAIPYTDLFTVSGGVQFGTADESCTTTVINGLLHVVVRYQGVNPQLYDGFNIPLYMRGISSELAAWTITPFSQTPATSSKAISGNATIKGNGLIQ